MIEILLSLILAMTGIARDVDPQLTAFAEQRVVQVQSDWSHNGMVYPEVLTYNDPERGDYDPVQRAAEQWRDSPSHWAILSNPDLTRIGCAVDVGTGAMDGVYYFVCVLDYALTGEPDSGIMPEASEAPILLPDTAMTYEEER